jgi:hypothetical protein
MEVVMKEEKTSMDKILAHLGKLPDGERECRITDFEHLMTDDIREKRANGTHWDEIWVTPFYKGRVFDDHLLCLGSTNKKHKIKRITCNKIFLTPQLKSGCLSYHLTAPTSEHRIYCILGKLVVESCLRQEISSLHTVRHFDGGSTNDSIENLGITDHKTRLRRRDPHTHPGKQVKIRKEKGNEIIIYESPHHVKGVAYSTIYDRVLGRKIVDGWRWSYDTLHVPNDEEFKQYSKHMYVSNMGRVARKVYENEFVEMNFSKKLDYIKIGRKYLHVVVYELFGEDPIKSGDVIDHINSKKHDNRLVNLRLMTAAENTRQALGKLYKLINQITGEEQTVPTLSKAAEITGYSTTTIRHVANRIQGKDGVIGDWYIDHAGDVNPVQAEYIKRQRITATI